MRDLIVGAALLGAAIALGWGSFGWLSSMDSVWTLLPIAGGAALIYAQLDDAEAARWRTGRRGRTASGARVFAGLVLVLLGVGAAVLSVLDLNSPVSVLIALVAMIGGALVVLAPWAVRLIRDLGAEQEARAREQVRADMAAHLHDSVLQTLALIQRASTDPDQVVRLARRQERDLRGWLYGGGPATAGTLDAAVRGIVDDVEERHAVTVDLIVVGDAAMDEQLEALVAALREAMTNAAVHAGGRVSVYVEAQPDEVEAYVRDRGPGFDPASVPADRLGVAGSIIGRMDRHGGSAQVRSVLGEGSEVRLRMPRAADRDPAPAPAAVETETQHDSERTQQ